MRATGEEDVEPGSSRDLPAAVDVVVPFFGCEESIRNLVSRTMLALGPHLRSLIIVHDGDSLASWETIVGLSESSPIRAIRLAQNSGQHQAIRIGLENSEAPVIVVMDCDLQDDPILIEELLTFAAPGQTVVGLRRESAAPKKDAISSSLHYGILSRISGSAVPNAASTFSVLSRDTADRIIPLMRGGAHYLHAVAKVDPAMHWWPYSRSKRVDGKSSYTTLRRLDHALKGISTWTTRPLRSVIVIGVLWLMASVLCALGALIFWVLGSPPEGWVSLTVLWSLSSASLVVMMGTIALYLSSILEMISPQPWLIPSEYAEYGKASSSAPWSH